MAILDLNDPVSMLRLRCGDVRDLPMLPDEVYQNALSEKKGNMKAAAILCCQYILAQLAFDSQQQLGVITVYGNQVFRQYRDYLIMVTKNPDFASISPIPYSGSNGTCPVIEFKKDWDRAYHDCCHKSWGKL
jgi:hypothetical protein